MITAKLMLMVLITTKGSTMKMNIIDKIAMLLLIIGGFNWGLVGWLDYNLVDKILGVGSTASRVIYAVVGVASVYCIFSMVVMLSSGSAKKS
jgi:uncharacterized membrane protein YuzA (DUF378 family)